MEIVSIPIEGKADSHLSEIYQSVEMKFAFLSEDNKQCHVFAKCRDFLHDAVRCSVTGSKMTLYDFRYDGEKDPKVCMDRMRMLVRVDTATNEKAIAKNDLIMEHSLRLINHYEDMVKEPLSTVVRLESWNKGSVWLFEGPALWVSSPFFVSMFTFLIRLGSKQITFETNEELVGKFKAIVDCPSKDNDGTYLVACYDKLDLIMKNHKVIKNGKAIDAAYTTKSIDIHSFHDKGGVVSLAKASSFSKRKNERFRGLLEGTYTPKKSEVIA